MTRVWDRKNRRFFEEKVYGGEWIASAYRPERSALGTVVQSPRVQKLVSQVVGKFYESGFSTRLIPEFLEKYDINMSEFVRPESGYKSFNDFFTRHLTPGARPFPTDSRALGAPAEGRLSVFELKSMDTELFIKGSKLPLGKLCGSPRVAEMFLGGHAFVFRLCPVDYHRFHFPDAGRAGPSNRIAGELHSVNPVAVAAVPDVFCRNERQLCLFESRHFGSLLLIEVGALCVGKIVQTYDAGARVERGQEKGYFAFGGSTTIMLTPKLWVKPDADLIERTNEGAESLVRLGEPIAKAGLTEAPRDV